MAPGLPSHAASPYDGYHRPEIVTNTALGPPGSELIMGARPTLAKQRRLGSWPTLALWLVLLTLWACAADPQAPPPSVRLLATLGADQTLRQGTRLFALGRDLSERRLLLRDADAVVRLLVELQPPQHLPPGSALAVHGATEVAWGTVQPATSPPEHGLALHSACLVGAGMVAAQSPADCLPIAAVWRTQLPEIAIDWSGGSHRFGDLVTVAVASTGAEVAELLVAGEGDSWLEIVTLQAPLPATATATVPLLPGFDPADDLAWAERVQQSGQDRQHGRLVVDPAWLGPAPGARILRARLCQRDGSGQSSGPWRDLHLNIGAPELTLPPAKDRHMQRGRYVGATVTGVPARSDDSATSGWRLGLSGTWHGLTTPLHWPLISPRRLPGRTYGAPDAAGPQQHRALLSSAAWFLGGWPEPPPGGPPLELDATFLLEVYSPAGTWSQTLPAGKWRLLATEQAIAPVFGAASLAGLQRYGLAAHLPTISARVRALVAGHFADYRVVVLAPGAELAPGEEVVRVAVLDRDPNGLDLLGADSSAGKDIGNRDLGEQLVGFTAAARVAGEVAYGGVFLNGFAHFSPTLTPAGLVADPMFDTLFAPWMPELGGTAAAADDPAAAAASEAMARLIAGSLSHEVGHTLGLPAVPGFHHPQDNPGWRMDQGRDRPFAERIGLPGALKEVWGEVDGAYLNAILGAGTD